ncbi:ATPase family associated with various cellular activities (AAA) [Paracoccus isoporae]|uniref:ATPase family associated with various cellular activities (AAA) n=1 Tax=Paracoccus isoporae TaxID=591205 RepID=A0A1G6WVA9_9RHOB|nr:ATP-binding protein [Paracoccus isoporae]SDD69822.1 ATPase family associated with various cellular activities (AAA) [Paracoccus isoporae]
MESRNEMELPEAEIRAHYGQALSLLTAFDHAPRLGKPAAAPAAERSPGIRRTTRFRSTTPGLAGRSTARAEGIQLIDRIEGVGGDDLPSPAAATVVRALRRALAIALAVVDEVAARSGAAELKRANLEGRLAPDRRGEFAELLAVESLAALSVFASATAFLLAEHAGPETVEGITADEILTDNPTTALQGALWELDQNLARAAQDDKTLIAAVIAFAEAVSAAVRARAETAPRSAAFTGASWRVAADEFPIAGFAPATRARGQKVQLAFKTPEEVVGNAIAKHQMMRLSRMLVAYDFDRRMNPFVELGGFIHTFLGDGKPGTGKTTLIQMMAGLINDYCTVAGYPFRYANLSIDNVDSYQGKSGQNARAFIDSVIDPAVIGFGTIDDIDQIAGKRGDKQSSSGQQEITAVLMEAFAGASTIVRGNATFGMFSNYAESIDDALRQRAGARFLIDGPQSRADYIDILALLLGKRHEIPVGDHDLMQAQAIRSAVAESLERHNQPQEAGLAQVWGEVTAETGPLDTLAEFGTYLHAISQADPRFTGRAIKNITDAIKARAMDFDMPDAWFESPEPFLHQPYASKLEMIAALRQPITAEMIAQEINRYADSEWRYAESSDETAIEEAVRNMERMDEAQRRYREGMK